VQFSVSGTEVWRRALIPESCTLEELSRLIQICLDWKNGSRGRFSSESSGTGADGEDRGGRKTQDDKARIAELCDRGISELLYEYGTKWTVRVIILSPYQSGKDEAIRCVAGAGAAPPELVSGPLRYRKILSALESGSDMEKQAALHELGADFVPDLFDMEKYNKDLNALYPVRK
jgi:hypothetical protein